ncbi:MAG: hypothetical protein RJA59_1499 [Pseudomonadota bacterium]
MKNLFLSVQSLVPASRSWDIKNADGTARDLTGLTPWLLINDAADAAPLIAEIEGTVSGSTAIFSVPGLLATNTRKTFPVYLRLKATVGGALADDGQWKGVCTVDGGDQLTTVEDLKAYLSITHSNADLDLWSAIVAASKWFESQTGRAISATTYTETQSGCGGQVIIPTYSPLVSVTSVTMNGEAATLSTGYGVTGYYQAGNVIRFRSQTVPSGEGNISVVYRAGYETIPDDVRAAVTEVAAVMYRERDRVGQQSKVFGGESVTYYYAPPARVVSTVEAYRWAQ